MVPRYHVLVVDPLEETHEVLRMALEGRGVRVVATCQPERGLALSRQRIPDLIVLDVEHLATAPAAVSDDFARESLAHRTPVLLIGSVRPRNGQLPYGEHVAKPYHYGPLIRKIEKLLATVQQPIARAA